MQKIGAELRKITLPNVNDSVALLKQKDEPTDAQRALRYIKEHERVDRIGTLKRDAKLPSAGELMGIEGYYHRNIFQTDKDLYHQGYCPYTPNPENAQNNHRQSCKDGKGHGKYTSADSNDSKMYLFRDSRSWTPHHQTLRNTYVRVSFWFLQVGVSTLVIVGTTWSHVTTLVLHPTPTTAPAAAPSPSTLTLPTGSSMPRSCLAKRGHRRTARSLSRDTPTRKRPRECTAMSPNMCLPGTSGVRQTPTRRLSP